jgi:hypothetical protein
MGLSQFCHKTGQISVKIGRELDMFNKLQLPSLLKSTVITEL